MYLKSITCFLCSGLVTNFEKDKRHLAARKEDAAFANRVCDMPATGGAQERVRHLC